MSSCRIGSPVCKNLCLTVWLLIALAVCRIIPPAFAQTGPLAYVAVRDSNAVVVIDTSTNTIVNSITVGGSPFDVALTPDGSRAYVSNFFNDSASVIDLATNTVVATVIGLGGRPSGVAVAPDGQRVYIANGSGSNIWIVDAVTNTLIGSIGVGQNPTP